MDQVYTFTEGGREHVETIALFNVRMALETERLSLDLDLVRKGVAHLVEHPEEGRYFIALQGGEVVAQAMVTREWSDWRNAPFFWLQSVYTLPQHRCRGLFKTLFKGVLEMCSREGACGLRLYVEGGNKAAQRVYEKLGMRESHYRLWEIETSRSLIER